MNLVSKNKSCHFAPFAPALHRLHHRNQRLWQDDRGERRDRTFAIWRRRRRFWVGLLLGVFWIWCFLFERIEVQTCNIVGRSWSDGSRYLNLSNMKHEFRFFFECRRFVPKDFDDVHLSLLFLIYYICLLLLEYFVAPPGMFSTFLRKVTQGSLIILSGGFHEIRWICWTIQPSFLRPPKSPRGSIRAPIISRWPCRKPRSAP